MCTKHVNEEETVIHDQAKAAGRFQSKGKAGSHEPGDRVRFPGWMNRSRSHSAKKDGMYPYPALQASTVPGQLPCRSCCHGNSGINEPNEGRGQACPKETMMTIDLWLLGVHKGNRQGSGYLWR